VRVACRLREIREARGLSLSELAAELPVDADGKPVPRIYRGDLSRIERGTMLPRDDWLEALGRLYGVEPSTWYSPPAGAIAGVVIERDGGKS
jgi:transcriptional regulator with XRE-family HTH domain